MNQSNLATQANTNGLIEIMDFYDPPSNPMEIQPQYQFNPCTQRYEVIPNNFVLVDSTIDGVSQVDIVAKSETGAMVDPKGVKEGEAVTGITLSGNGANKLIGKDLIEIFEYQESPEFVKIDEWVPEPEDFVFKTVRGAVMMDVSSFFMMDPNISLDGFVMSTKRSYNNPDMREHTIHYLNYFEKFYDRDHELVTLYSKLKFFIDCENIAYTKDAFINDLRRYFFRGNIFIKLGFMNEANYSLNLTYKNVKNPNLQYSDRHGRIMMKTSVIMNSIIPLICHFMHMRGIQDSRSFLLEVYDVLFQEIQAHYNIDLYNKLYETAFSNVSRTEKRNQAIWNMQDIRGIDVTTHSLQSVENIIINIMPKYRYDGNLLQSFPIQECMVQVSSLIAENSPERDNQQPS